jgi:hypothetical protein
MMRQSRRRDPRKLPICYESSTKMHVYKSLASWLRCDEYIPIAMQLGCGTRTFSLLVVFRIYQDVYFRMFRFFNNIDDLAK